MVGKVRENDHGCWQLVIPPRTKLVGDGLAKLLNLTNFRLFGSLSSLNFSHHYIYFIQIIVIINLFIFLEIFLRYKSF